MHIIPTLALLYAAATLTSAHPPPNHPAQNPLKVTTSTLYRVDIMGFPNARGLDDQNLGILDQRRVHEWVRDNIKAFGGDPEKITLWGQSAGAASTEFHAFAYHKDPIAKGFVMTSGTASMGIPPPDPTYANFTFVAQSLGCNISTPESELQCMRQQPMAEIMQFIGQRRDNGTTPALSFVPTPNEKVVFSNYTERYNLRLVTKAPAIIGSTTDEGTTLVPYTDINIGPDRALVDSVTKLTFYCPAARTTATRARNGLTTYRYLYAGNFTNTSPVPWLGAYLSGDLPYLFGMYGDFTEGGGQRSETEVSEIMQDYLLAFMKDPERGLRREGWPETSSGLLMKFLGERRAKGVDRACG